MSGEFILDTDASNVGIGAVLSQRQEDGTEKVVAYASRTLTKPERNYCVTRRELLAVVAFVKYFKQYLYGQKFTVRSDHGALRWLTNFRNPEGQLTIWMEILSEYNFTIEHRAGRIHQNADALSCKPCNQCGREVENGSKEEKTKITSDTSLGMPLDAAIGEREEREVHWPLQCNQSGR